MPYDGDIRSYQMACDVIARAWTPRELMSVWEWADKHLHLPAESSAEDGKYQTDRVPMSREVMECLSPQHPARKVVAMVSSQLFKTQVGINWLTYHIDHDPRPMLIVYPTIDMAKQWSKERLSPTIAATPQLASILPATRSRDGENTVLHKTYPGGGLKIAGANSPASLSSKPCPIVYADEVDRYPVSVGKEGDPITIAQRAQITYPRKRKTYISSTPTIKALSRIFKEFQASDQRYYHVPCPQCGELQKLEWKNFHWTKGAPQDAHFVCELNGCIILEHHKPEMLADEKMGGRARWIAENPASNVPGFHAWAAYASLGLGLDWPSIAQMWDDCEGDPEKEKAFINIYRAEVFDDPDEALQWREIADRAIDYRLRTIPKDIVVLSAGVDVQADRLELQILGWGRGGRCAVIDYADIPGDPTTSAPWARLDELLLQPFTNQWGMPLRVSVTCIDSGYLPDEVLKFTRPRAHRHIYATKGSSKKDDQAVASARKQDHKVSGAQVKRGQKAWMLGTNALKTTIHLWLKGDRGKQPHEYRVMFSKALSEEYFTQLCSEVWDPYLKRWVKTQRRNEALDTFVYAVAASRHPSLRLHQAVDADWNRLESILQPVQGDLLSPQSDTPVAAAARNPEPQPGVAEETSAAAAPVASHTSATEQWLADAPADWLN